MEKSSVPSDAGKLSEMADGLEVEAQQLRARAEAIDGIENTALYLSHIIEQFQELVQLLDAPKVVERDERGRPTGIRIGTE